jgi:hypothetical protein
MDRKVNLTSEEDTRRHLTDGQEPTHNRSVAGSRPASPPSKADGPGGRVSPSRRWCLAIRPSHSRAARARDAPGFATEARLMLAARGVATAVRAAAPSCGPPRAGRRRRRNASLSGDPPGGLLGHPWRGSRGRQLLGLRHRDGWQEVLSGTTLTVSESVRGLGTCRCRRRSVLASRRYSACLATQLQVALDSRGLVKRAKDALMERECLDEQEAFAHQAPKAESAVDHGSCSPWHPIVCRMRSDHPDDLLDRVWSHLDPS